MLVVIASTSDVAMWDSKIWQPPHVYVRGGLAGSWNGDKAPTPHAHASLRNFAACPTNFGNRPSRGRKLSIYLVCSSAHYMYQGQGNLIFLKVLICATIYLASIYENTDVPHPTSLLDIKVCTHLFLPKMIFCTHFFSKLWSPCVRLACRDFFGVLLPIA